MNYKNFTEEKQRGFITLLAMVITVTVIGGGIMAGAKSMTNVQKAGCGNSLNVWRSGNIYARLADPNDSEALDQAIKCQKAITESVKSAEVVTMSLKAAKVGATGMGQIGYIGTTVLKHFRDYVDRASDPDNKPPKKDKSLPKDVKKVVKEKIEKEKKSQKEEEKKEPSIITRIFDDIEEKIQKIDVGDDAGEEWKKSDKNKIIDSTKKDDSKQPVAKTCPIGFSGTSAPKLRIKKHGDSKPGSRVSFTTEYSDPEGDIRKMAVRTIIIIPEYNFRQEYQWQTRDFKPSKTCGTETSPFTTLPDELSGSECFMKVEVYLIDAAGNKSNTVDYTAYHSSGQ